MTCQLCLLRTAFEFTYKSTNNTKLSEQRSSKMKLQNLIKVLFDVLEAETVMKKVPAMTPTDHSRSGVHMRHGELYSLVFGGNDHSNSTQTAPVHSLLGLVLQHMYDTLLHNTKLPSSNNNALEYRGHVQLQFDLEVPILLRS